MSLKLFWNNFRRDYMWNNIISAFYFACNHGFRQIPEFQPDWLKQETLSSGDWYVYGRQIDVSSDDVHLVVDASVDEAKWDVVMFAAVPCSTSLTPSTPAVPDCCCSKCSVPYWSNPPFLIFDIRALWRSVLSARAPECQKLKMAG